jgi:hypothetical protein
MSRTIRRSAAGLLVAALLAGCGARPPQAPDSQAKKLGSATGAIATACGRSYRATSLAGHRARVRQIDRHARTDARALAAVYRRNPDWIYLGQTVAATARDTIALTRDCGLRQTAAIVVRATGGR